MALVKKENFNGIPVSAAYHKVARVSLDLMNQIAEVTVNVYFNEQERQNNPRQPMNRETYTCYGNNPDGTTFEEFFGTSSQTMIPAQSAYEYLKSLPDYIDSQDLL